MRQSLRQRPHRRAHRDAVRRLAIAQSRQIGRSRSGLPSTMVDRIVPETTDFDRSEVSSALGMTAVVTEPFQPNGSLKIAFRPDSQIRTYTVGCDAVRAHETAAAQRQSLGAGLDMSAISAGHETIGFHHDRPSLCSACPTGHQRHRGRRWRCLKAPSVTVHRCCSAFPMPPSSTTTWQIAMDGSQKLPQRLLTCRSRLQVGFRLTRMRSHV